MLCPNCNQLSDYCTDFIVQVTDTSATTVRAFPPLFLLTMDICNFFRKEGLQRL